VHAFLAKNKTNDSHPTRSYTPGLVPCDFFLFPKFKLALKGRKFNDITMIEAKSQDHLPSFKQYTSRNASRGGTIAGLAI
jgi:hypothetical protein